MTREEAVPVAYNWHGGQNSLLYAFASCEGVVKSEKHRWKCIADIEGCLTWWDENAETIKSGVWPEHEEGDWAKLTALREYIEAAPIEEVTHV